MLTKNISFKNFQFKKNNKKIKQDLNRLLEEENEVVGSLSSHYKNSYTKKTILGLKKYQNVRLIGMGGSTLGTESIYDFLRHKIKKKFYFENSLKTKSKISISKKKFINLIVSKSGNTLETISNSNIYIKKKIKIFLLQEKKIAIYYC